MQAMCAEIAFLLFGRVTGDAADPAEQPDVPWCGRRPAGRRRGPSCPPGVAPLAPKHRSSMASRPRHESNESPHRSHLKKQVGRGES
jgi:hypothetical protein